MTYWPGTNIVKSKNNAFDWRNTASKITATTQWKQSEISTQRMAGSGGDINRQFTIFSKAVASRVRPTS